MARKHQLKATGYKCIFEAETLTGEKHFFARFSYNGVRYADINLNKKWNSNIKTAKQASEALVLIKHDLSKGIDAFEDKSSKIEDLVLKYLSERSESYRYSNTYFYYKHIHKTIGHKYITKVTKADFDKIKEQMKESGIASSTMKKAKQLLSPIFKEAFQDEVIRRNILENYVFGSDGKKASLQNRINEDLEVAIRRIYNKALEEEDDYAALFLMSIMCARRLGEITAIEYRDIKDGVVNVRAITTKTKKQDIEKGKLHQDDIVEQYKLPKEVRKRIGEERDTREKVFFHDYRTYLDKYADFIDNKCELKVAKDENGNDYKIRSHDNRNFIMSILGRKVGRDTVGYMCLSHSDGSNMNERYDSIELKERMKVYKKYWKILRI